LIIERFWENRKEFIKLNPSGEVPVMLSDDNKFCGHYAISEYIENKFEDTLPKDLANKAENRRLIDWFDNKFHKEVSKIIINERVEKRFRSLEKGGGLPNTDNIRLAKNNLNNHLKYIEYLLERRFWLVNNKIELADLTAAAHISCIDYLGDMPWEKFPEIKHWYSRIKSRPSFRSILADKIIGIPPRGNYALLDF
jgi:glutathione S-transferase